MKKYGNKKLNGKIWIGLVWVTIFRDTKKAEPPLYIMPQLNSGYFFFFFLSKYISYGPNIQWKWGEYEFEYEAWVCPVPVCWELAAAVHRTEGALLQTWPLLRCISPENLKKIVFQIQATCLYICHGSAKAARKVAWIFENATCKYRTNTWNIAHHLLECPLSSALFVLGWAGQAALAEHWIYRGKESAQNFNRSFTVGKIPVIMLIFPSVQWENQIINVSHSGVPLSRVMRETSRCSWTTWFSLYWR